RDHCPHPASYPLWPARDDRCTAAVWFAACKALSYDPGLWLPTACRGRSIGGGGEGFKRASLRSAEAPTARKINWSCSRGRGDRTFPAALLPFYNERRSPQTPALGYCPLNHYTCSHTTGRGLSG